MHISGLVGSADCWAVVVGPQLAASTNPARGSHNFSTLVPYSLPNPLRSARVPRHGPERER